MVLQIANKIGTWKTYQKRQARSQSGYLQGSQSPNQEHMVLRLRVLGLWNDTLHFPLPLVCLYGPVLSPCFRSAQSAPSAALKHSCAAPPCCLSGSTHKDTPVLRSLLWFLYPKIIPPALGVGGKDRTPAS